ncbi:MAG: magnesium protoporphyrin IX methyltransferase [Synechococcales cyanobacterium CRU_2_2]|nr:magnesium protoporphyrin IX methyltransferase [Synechococcales cyanobacterium CRU_2_2]
MTASNRLPSNLPNSDEQTIVRDYFNATGFDRWRRIYGTTDEVNRVQLDIRMGHQQTVDSLLAWLDADGNLAGMKICDAGCGVGSLTLPLLERGARVSASDISEKMVGEARDRAQAQFSNPNAASNRPALGNVDFSVQDLEAITGRYHTVICLDVLIHYPTEKAASMIAHLASLSEERLILSFAPKTVLLSLLKKVGEFFPGPSKTTRAYQHKESDIIQILEFCGFEAKRKILTSTSFYYSKMIEAVRR